MYSSEKDRAVDDGVTDLALMDDNTASGEAARTFKTVQASILTITYTGSG